MGKVKPIKAGCLAMTINCMMPSNNYQFVKVLNDVAPPSRRKEKGAIFWKVDKVFELRRADNKALFGMTDVLPDTQLIRIDDPDLELEDETEEYEWVLIDEFGFDIKESSGIWRK